MAHLQQTLLSPLRLRSFQVSPPFTVLTSYQLPCSPHLPSVRVGACIIGLVDIYLESRLDLPHASPPVVTCLDLGNHKAASASCISSAFLLLRTPGQLQHSISVLSDIRHIPNQRDNQQQRQCPIVLNSACPDKKKRKPTLHPYVPSVCSITEQLHISFVPFTHDGFPPLFFR